MNGSKLGRIIITGYCCERVIHFSYFKVNMLYNLYLQLLSYGFVAFLVYLLNHFLSIFGLLGRHFFNPFWFLLAYNLAAYICRYFFTD